MIPFNKPYLTGKETKYIEQAVQSGKISGNGMFTKKCHDYFEKKYGFKKVLLTTSCTDALEMCAILANIQVGDEVIVPSYTFVSTALPFIRQGAKIVFADSRKDHPNLDESKLESLITPRTKAIVPVHYAGMACDMEIIMALATKYNLIVIEDAAQAIDSFYKNRPLGSIGHFGAFSFHETKNVMAGEGGMLVVNDPQIIPRAEIIWEKGTNRAKFFRGEIDKYNWVDTGSSFLPSEIISAFLWAQLEKMDEIQRKRIWIWNQYKSNITDWAKNLGIELPLIDSYATNNGHLFYLICNSEDQRAALKAFLLENRIMAVSHYISLNSSPYYLQFNKDKNLMNSERFTKRLLRLPLFFDLDVQKVIEKIISFKYDK